MMTSLVFALASLLLLSPALAGKAAHHSSVNEAKAQRGVLVQKAAPVRRSGQKRRADTISADEPFCVRPFEYPRQAR